MAHKWYSTCFDSNWVRCNACRNEYPRKSVEGKRKCPTCKLDTRGNLPITHIEKAGTGVKINGRFVFKSRIEEAAKLLGIKVEDRVAVAGDAIWRRTPREDLIMVSIPLAAGNFENRHRPTKRDMKKNLDSIQRVIDGKITGPETNLLHDTKSILEAIYNALPE